MDLLAAAAAAFRDRLSRVSATQRQHFTVPLLAGKRTMRIPVPIIQRHRNDTSGKLRELTQGNVAFQPSILQCVGVERHIIGHGNGGESASGAR